MKPHALFGIVLAAALLACGLPGGLPAESAAGGRVRSRDGMWMVYIPAGPFEMGQEDQADAPRRTVTLRAYWIDQTEVSHAMYRKCVQADVCTPPAEGAGNTSDLDHPVMKVDWQQASTYCAWAGVRLPTEAEWEKAARGTDGRTYPWGEQEPTPELVNYDRHFGGTRPVGSFPQGASPYGVLDMAGSTWEWVSDAYQEDAYRTTPAEDPQGPDHPEQLLYRVIRGGGWDNPKNFLFTYLRNFSLPEYALDNLGFRCAADE